VQTSRVVPSFPKLSTLCTPGIYLMIASNNSALLNFLLGLVLFHPCDNKTRYSMPLYSSPSKLYLLYSYYFNATIEPPCLLYEGDPYSVPCSLGPAVSVFDCNNRDCNCNCDSVRLGVQDRNQDHNCDHYCELDQNEECRNNCYLVRLYDRNQDSN
jgi:hypothetical protein